VGTWHFTGHWHLCGNVIRFFGGYVILWWLPGIFMGIRLLVWRAPTILVGSQHFFLWACDLLVPTWHPDRQPTFIWWACGFLAETCYLGWAPDVYFGWHMVFWCTPIIYFAGQPASCCEPSMYFGGQISYVWAPSVLVTNWHLPGQLALF